MVVASCCQIGEFRGGWSHREVPRLDMLCSVAVEDYSPIVKDCSE